MLALSLQLLLVYTDYDRYARTPVSQRFLVRYQTRYISWGLVGVVEGVPPPKLLEDSRDFRLNVTALEFRDAVRRS